MIEKISFSTKGKDDIIDITPLVKEIIQKNKIKNGLCLLSSPASTCGLTTLEYEPNLREDFKEFLEHLASSKKEYRHHQTWGEDNGRAHLLSSLFKPYLCLTIENGELLLGTWQQIVFIDFDTRPRERTLTIQLIAS
jgi:secondary thiamine-phosphate synthase enzyme